MKNVNVSDEMRFPLTIIVVGLDNEIPKYKMLLAQIFFFVLIGIHFMQDWTATTRQGVTRREAKKQRLQDTENLFRKNLQLKDVC